MTATREEIEQAFRGAGSGAGVKALSIRQPDIHAILHLGKRVENRDWAGARTAGLCSCTRARVSYPNPDVAELMKYNGICNSPTKRLPPPMPPPPPEGPVPRPITDDGSWVWWCVLTLILAGGILPIGFWWLGP